MILRPYQIAALDAVREAYRSGKRAPLLCSPTGSGKSKMTGYMLSRTKKRALIICHRAELLDMISGSLSLAHGVIRPGKPTPREQILVGMIQTIQRRLDDLAGIEWVISDECHLAMAAGWQRVLKHFGTAHHLGMSATPCRLDGRGLGAVFDTIVYGPSISELVSRGFLVPCRVFAPPVAVEKIKTVAGDFDMHAAAEAFDRPTITGRAVEQLRKHGPQRRTIVFCCTRAHAEHVASEFRSFGFAAASIDGSMSADQRERRFAQFRDGRLQVLTNVELATTGVDIPQIEAAIFLRPTESLALYLQMVGRILRIFPGKRDALLLDHVGNVVRHGMPDEPREWTLDGRAKRSAAPAVRQCPECFAAHAPSPRCPACGHVYTVAAPQRTAPEIKGGDLVETDAARVAQIREASLKSLLKIAKTAEALKEIARIRGYDQRWVQHILASRGGRRPHWAGKAA